MMLQAWWLLDLIIFGSKLYLLYLVLIEISKNFDFEGNLILCLGFRTKIFRFQIYY